MKLPRVFLKRCELVNRMSVEKRWDGSEGNPTRIRDPRRGSEPSGARGKEGKRTSPTEPGDPTTIAKSLREAPHRRVGRFPFHYLYEAEAKVECMCAYCVREQGRLLYQPTLRASLKIIIFPPTTRCHTRAPRHRRLCE